MFDQQNSLDAVDEIYTNTSPIVEFVKMQISFWEKLVVLDAATLAASFTASGLFREHVFGDGGVGYLTAAWKLLFCGIAFCMLAQWVAIPGAIAISGNYYGMRVLSLLNQRRQKARTQAELQYETAISAEIVAVYPKLRTRGNICSRLAGGLGSAGVLASIAAFYWLYRFVSINIRGWGH